MRPVPVRDPTPRPRCMHARRIIAAAALALALPGAAAAADAARGGTLAEQWCNACHSTGHEPPRQQDAGPLFSDLAKQDAAYLAEAIRRPHDFMPDFPKLDETDLADLVAYIQTVR